MSTRKKRDIGGIIVVEEQSLRWAIKSEPMWHTTDGDIGMRLTVVKHDETLTRHGTLKAWRELVLQYPFDPKQHHASRFPDRPRVTPEIVAAGVRLALEAGWVPDSRGRPFELVLEESDLVR
ncbi:MAG: hypothetical protein JWP16_239 [Alphaproteobacteria bacterium]|nr:hypothetical protein [Alphaproteobacteria bacterium]